MTRMSCRDWQRNINYNDGVYHNVKKCLVVKTRKVKRIVGARMHKYTCKQTYTYTTYAHALVYVYLTHADMHILVHIHIHIYTYTYITHGWTDGGMMNGRTDQWIDRKTAGITDRQAHNRTNRQTVETVRKTDTADIQTDKQQA